MLTILIVLLLIAALCMAVRDGRGFFADFLKVTILVLAVVISVLTWLPFPHK